MNVTSCENKVVMLLDEMKVNKTSRTEYLAKFYDYLDIAQKRIAQTKPIVKTYIIIKTASNNAYDKFDLPNNLYQINRLYDDNLNNIEYLYLKPNKIALNGNLEGNYTLEYKAYPVTILPTDDKNTTNLELDEDACQAVPYFIAAQMLIKEDDQRPYDKYMSEFDSIMSNLNTDNGPTVRIATGVRLF